MTDELDLRIINLLMENSKWSYRKLAARLGVSVATVMNRVNRLNKEKIIKKYSAIIDYEKLGYELSAIVEVRVSRGKMADIEKKIAEHPNVSAVFDTTGHFDITVLANFKSRMDMDRFLKKINTYDFIARTETKIILNTIKDEHIKVA